MLRPLPYALGLYIVGIALGKGGYFAWASLLFEVGAAGLLLWTVVAVVWQTPTRVREANLEVCRARRRLPLRVRYRSVGALLSFLTRGRIRRPTVDVEILPPGAPPDAVHGTNRDTVCLLGYPFRRAYLTVPLVLLTLWMGFSVVPLSKTWLAALSPQALALRAEAESLAGVPASGSPWSLAPFLTLRSLWWWMACVALFYASVHLADDPARVERLTRLLLAACVVFGILGVGQWLLGLREMVGAGGVRTGMPATGTFANRNHYATFMEMLLLCSLGWMGYRWRRIGGSSGRGSSVWMPEPDPELRKQERVARLLIAGLGIALASLGLLFSLSRSGITFALLGCAVFALLVTQSATNRGRAGGESGRAGRHRRYGDPRSQASRAGRLGRVPRVYWAVVLAVLALAFWIGVDPVLKRFEMVPEHWEAEHGRVQVWVDSVDAVKDFWRTGSGLSTFRYVYPLYRSYGGTIFYSWAHNDYLQFLVELGVPGALLLLWIVAAVFARALRLRRALVGEASLLHLHAGYTAAAVAVAFHSFTDFGLHLAANSALLSVIVGVVVGLGRPEGSGR